MENKFTVYILYSEMINKYYVGYTSVTVEERLDRHLSNHKGYSAQTKDWKVVFTKEFDAKVEAMHLEKQIKSRGIRRYLMDIGMM
ncbi:MAG: GIY-YIG nuclease family protein [Saprospiraceae bacterium]